MPGFILQGKRRYRPYRRKDHLLGRALVALSRLQLINVGVRRPSLLVIALKMLVEMINQRYAVRSYHSALSIIDTKVDPDLGLDYICAKQGDPPQEERGGRPLPRVYRQWR